MLITIMALIFCISLTLFLLADRLVWNSIVENTAFVTASVSGTYVIGYLGMALAVMLSQGTSMY